MPKRRSTLSPITFETLPGVGNLPQLDAPHLVLERLKAFLSGDGRAVAKWSLCDDNSTPTPFRGPHFARPILALLVYGKGEADDLSPAGKRQLAAMVAEIKAAWKGK